MHTELEGINQLDVKCLERQQVQPAAEMPILAAKATENLA